MLLIVVFGSISNSSLSKENTKIKISNTIFNVKIAKTAEERRIGLSGYKSLEKGKGMLFVFDKTDTHPAFWMKGVNLPIDIIWISQNRVIQITPNVPTVPPGTTDEQIPTYTPNDNVDHVLEIPAFEAKNNGLKVNDPLTIYGE